MTKDPKERNSNEFSSDVILENDRKINEANWGRDGEGEEDERDFEDLENDIDEY